MRGYLQFAKVPDRFSIIVQVSTDFFLAFFFELLFTSTYFLGILLWLLKNVTPLFLGGRQDIGSWQMSEMKELCRRPVWYFIWILLCFSINSLLASEWAFVQLEKCSQGLQPAQTLSSKDRGQKLLWLWVQVGKHHTWCGSGSRAHS